MPKKTKTKAEAEPKKKNETVSQGEENKLKPEMVARITALRSQVRESFGNVVMSMMVLPRYRYQTVADLQHLVLEPLIRDRIAIAYPSKKETDSLSDMAGVAIWASVSDEVDAKIRDQVKAGTYPIRLGAEEWTSGTNNWLLDVIAPGAEATKAVIANFRQIIKEGSLVLHPVVAQQLDKKTLESMGAEKMPTKPKNATLN